MTPPVARTTIPERIVRLETEAEACAAARMDVESRLRKIELLLWGLMAIQVGLKFVF